MFSQAHLTGRKMCEVRIPRASADSRLPMGSRSAWLRVSCAKTDGGQIIG